MCNAYRLMASPHEIYERFAAAGLPLAGAEASGRPNLEPMSMTRPTQTLPILRPLNPETPGEGVELVKARWGLVPWFHKGALKDWKFLGTNARAETLSTARPFRDAYRRRRCLIPADGFYEWTGERGSKTRWLFTRPGVALWCFPGLWDRWVGPDGPLDSFTLVTTAPGPDAAPYHDRQPVILTPEGWRAWLNLAADPSPLLRAGPAGELDACRS